MSAAILAGEPPLMTYLLVACRLTCRPRLAGEQFLGAAGPRPGASCGWPGAHNGQSLAAGTRRPGLMGCTCPVRR